MNLRNKSIINVSLSILAVYVTTSAHHLYGAWLYETPWRNHIAYQGFTWLIVSYLILLPTLKWSFTWIKWIFVLFAGFFFVGAIGFYEGFYNHVLKNILYFGGVERGVLLRMYPPPKYELPDDFLFELSGVFTFFVSLWCLSTMIKFLRKTKVSPSSAD